MNRKSEINSRYLQRRRLDLIDWLGQAQEYRFQDRNGPRCEICWKGGVLNAEELQFDHVNGERGWSMKEKGPLQRLKLLEQEAAASKVQLLCRSHNAGKQDSDVEQREEIGGVIPF